MDKHLQHLQLGIYMTGESKVITTRKLNQVRNSFYVYLPRNWCERFNLSKDSEVKIEQSIDGVLRIVPPHFTTQGAQKVKFAIDEDNKESIVNLLIGSYIVGAGEIELEFGSNLDISTREEVSQWVRRLPGFEILDEHSQSFIISDTSEKQGVFPILRRQFSTVKYMLTSLVETMNVGNHSQARRIIDRDEDVDRHRYFVERLCHLSLQNPAYARKIQIAPPDALHFSLATKYIERIADHICEAIEALLRIEKVNTKLVNTAEKLVEAYNETTTVFFRIDRNKGMDRRSTADEAKKAFTCHLHTKEVSKELDKIGTSYAKSSSSETLLVLHLGRISSYCEDIAEVAMNRIIEFGFDQ